MTPTPTLQREDLFRALGDNPRLVRAFEQLPAVIDETRTDVASNAGATDAIQDATVLTLSPNATFNNERVLKIGAGIKAVDDGTYLTLTASDLVPHVEGGFPMFLTAQQTVRVVLPERGVLATLSEPETLSNKVLRAPVTVDMPSAADDAGAATAGVPVGGLYHALGVVRVRRT